MSRDKTSHRGNPESASDFLRELIERRVEFGSCFEKDWRPGKERGAAKNVFREPPSHARPIDDNQINCGAYPRSKGHADRPVEKGHSDFAQ